MLKEVLQENELSQTFLLKASHHRKSEAALSAENWLFHSLTIKLRLPMTWSLVTSIANIKISINVFSLKNN